jgi:hypothetical protein
VQDCSLDILNILIPRSSQERHAHHDREISQSNAGAATTPYGAAPAIRELVPVLAAVGAATESDSD